MFAKQSYWYKLRRLLFKLKAILLVTCLQSNPIGTNFAGFCSNVGARRLFSSPAGFLLGAYWLADSRSPDGGGESHHFTGNRNPSPGCLPAPARQPHIINLIPQLQKPTRKISDTWIIDTGKRETRYQLVKVHQTIRQPHTRRLNQSILKDINPEYSFEGLLLKLKIQYFGHLKGKTDSLENTLMLKKIESRRRV